MKPLSLLLLALVWSSAVFGAASAFEARAAETFVPAQFNERQDSAGFGWQMTPNGLGSDNRGCLSNAQTLLIGGSQVHFPQAQMTTDGGVYQFSGVKVQNIDIARRVRFDFTASAAQFVDSFTNKTGSPISLNVTLTSRLGNTAQATISDQGRPFSGSFGAQESGVVLVAQQQSGMPSPIFHFGMPKSRVRPTVSVQNNFIVNATYSLTIASGKTVSIVTGVGQASLGGVPDSAALKRLYKPFTGPIWTRSIPPELRGSLANTVSTGNGSRDDLDSVDPLAELGERGAHDQLLVGTSTRLRGALGGATISVEAKRGRRELPLDRIAAIYGGNQTGRASRLVLRDGQVLVGPIEVPDFKFTLNSGLDVTCSVANLDRLVLKETPEDGKPPAEVFAYIDLLEGDRLAVAHGDPQKITIVTAWGACDIGLEEIDSFASGNPSQGTITHRLALRDGSVFSTMVSDGDLKLKSTEYGEQNWSVFDIRRMRSAHRKAAVEGSEPSAAHAVLLGDNVFVGQVELPLIHLVVQGQTIPVQPGNLKSLKREEAAASAATATLTDAKPVYVVELWDGDTASGELKETVLPLRTVGGLLQVPIGDLVEFRTPSPTVPESMRARITELLADLGHVDYNRREAATKELRSLGETVKEQGADALKATTDPEVRKRLQTLLDGLKE